MITESKAGTTGRKDLHPCICGCGRLTARRFFPGCDTAFYGRLRDAVRCGDSLARLVHNNAFKQNRRVTFPEQRRLARMWLDRTSGGSAIAAD